MKALAKAQKDHIEEMREVVQQIVGSINSQWATITAFTEGVPYAIGLDLPCGVIPNPIAAHYVFDEVHGEMRRMSPTASLLVVDPEIIKPPSEVPLVVSQFLEKRAASTVVSGKEATKDIIHSYLKFFPYDFLLLVTHGSRTRGSIQLYGDESLSHDDLVYLTEMNNLKRPLVFNNACSSWYAVGRNFLWFGARAYIGTLWSVWTDSAAEMVKYFSGHLFTLPMAQSLFKAKEIVAGSDPNSSSAYILIGSALARFQALEATASDLQKAVDLLVEYDRIRVGGIQQTPPQELTQPQVPKRLDYIFQILAGKVLTKAPLLWPYVDFLQAHWLSGLVDAEIPHPYPPPREILEKALAANRDNLNAIEKDTSLDETDKALGRQILRRNVPMSLVNLGIEYRREAKEELAIDCFSEAAAAFEELRDFVGIGDCQANWGITLRRSQPSNSRDRLQTARSYYLRAGNLRKTIMIDLALGDLARDEQQWQVAKAHYLMAKKTSATLGDHQEEVEATLLALETDAISGEIDSILGATTETVDFCDRRGLIELSCRARLLQATCFFEKGWPDLGMSCIIDALTRCRSLPGPKVFNVVMRGFLNATLVAVSKGYREAVVEACRRVKSEWPAAEQIQSTMTAIELACLGHLSQAKEAVASLGEPFVGFVERLIGRL